MASNFPATIDVFTNPGGNDYLDDAAVPHSDQHANANDAIEALQAKVGIDNSEDPTSIDYILAHKVDQEAGKGLSSNDYTDAERTKLAGIAESANAYTHPANHAPSIITQDANNRFTTDAEKEIWNGKLGASAIGDTVAPLVDGLVPSANLPSYVNNVIEASTFASLPATGESGKIYVLDTPYTAGGITSSQFRWSGSAYAPIIASPGTTDAVTEGSTNLYFTVARVRAVVLTGLSLVTNAAISATDTVLSALGKLQKQITDLAAANTGDETAETIKAKLGISTLSGSNTGDQTLEGLGGVPAVSPSMSGLLTHSGDIALTGSGKRITGDFSNATLANRLMFQGSTVNGATDVGVTPNGTSTTAGFTAYNAADPTNASTTTLQTTSTQSKLIAGKTGAGSYKPLALSVGGADVVTYSEAAATLGNMIASVSKDSQLLYLIQNVNAGAGANSSLRLQSNSGTVTLSKLSTASGLTGGAFLYNSGGALWIGTTDTGAVHLITNNALAASLDQTGSFLLNKATGGLGYGAGAGGTVTQTTSKSTAVTLNRPCGQITMNNAALAAGETVIFTFNNSLLTVADGILPTLSNQISAFVNYRVEVVSTGAGFCGFRVTNISAGPLSEAFVFNFQIIKGAST